MTAVVPENTEAGNTDTAVSVKKTHFLKRNWWILSVITFAVGFGCGFVLEEIFKSRLIKNHAEIVANMSQLLIKNLNHLFTDHRSAVIIVKKSP